MGLRVYSRKTGYGAIQFCRWALVNPLWTIFGGPLPLATKVARAGGTASIYL
jgi:hypothetical protein